MKIFMSVIFLILLSSCVKKNALHLDRFPPSGCVNKPVRDFLDPNLSILVYMGATDLFIARYPSGEGVSGPIKFIYFDRGPIVSLGEPSGVPRIIYALGDSYLTCSVAIDENRCAAAKDVYAKITSQPFYLALSQNDPDVIFAGGTIISI